MCLFIARRSLILPQTSKVTADGVDDYDTDNDDDDDDDAEDDFIT